MQVIKHRTITLDPWYLVEADSTLDQVPGGSVIVPVSLWLEHKDELQQKTDALGIVIDGDTDLSQISDDLNQFSIIAIRFPVFRDGRGYSIARALRKDYGFTNELRAIGNVLRDQVAFMERVGFDSAEIDNKQDAADAINVFDEITVKYQASVDEPLPLYKRHSL